MNNILTDMAKRIKIKRQELNLSQEQLAQKVGYKDRTSIAKIESGKVDLSHSKIIEFANVLKTTPSYLMGWEDKQTSSIKLMKEKNQETQRLDNLSGFSNETEDYRWIARKAKSLTPEQQKKLKNVIASIFDEEDDDEE